MFGMVYRYFQKHLGARVKPEDQEKEVLDPLIEWENEFIVGS